MSFLEQGKTFTAPEGGTYLVPPARMKEILDSLDDKP